MLGQIIAPDGQDVYTFVKLHLEIDPNFIQVYFLENCIHNLLCLLLNRYQRVQKVHGLQVGHCSGVEPIDVVDAEIGVKPTGVDPVVSNEKDVVGGQLFLGVEPLAVKCFQAVLK